MIKIPLKTVVKTLKRRSLIGSLTEEVVVGGLLRELRRQAADRLTDQTPNLVLLQERDAHQRLEQLRLLVAGELEAAGRDQDVTRHIERRHDERLQAARVHQPQQARRLWHAKRQHTGIHADHSSQKR